MSTIRTDPWQGFDGANLGYVHQLYEQYLKNPLAVDAEFRSLFERWGAPPQFEAAAPDLGLRTQPAVTVTGDATEAMAKAVAAVELAERIRLNGHLISRINSFVDSPETSLHLFEPAAYGLTDADLRVIPARVVWPEAPGQLATAADVINHLMTVYTGSTAYQFMHIPNIPERNWLSHRVEAGAARPIDDEERRRLLRELTEVEEFERYLHRTFAGQKRFSVEGLETVVPMLTSLIHQAANDGTQHVLIGMAHRGRLSVLAHVLGKPYAKIFSEFHHAPNKDLVPSEGSMGVTYGWTGDVKYHLGAHREPGPHDTTRVRVTLAHNPSHLEFVGAVVEGYTRAAQEERQVSGSPLQQTGRALCISLHGDAAFPGEGIVAETINLSKLRGYRVGGTIHIITNNQIGFTTDSADSRSTRYASGVARGFELPIVHVNADDPEACLQAIHLAYAYRQEFHKDFLIDLIGYRRHGHNETDDPIVTQPLLYAKVAKHPGVRSLYAGRLAEAGAVDAEAAAAMSRSALERLQQAYDQMKEEGTEPDAPQQLDWGDDEIGGNTAVSEAHLTEYNRQLLQWPAEFKVYPKLAKILERRYEALTAGIDWAHAETLAFASILAEGTPIRMTGQDVERGTFAHRHLVLHDAESGKAFTPLQHFPAARASFAVYNSPLSETAVLGFEYGYDVLAKESLVLWEAQFGDFANVAQVMIDQFLAAGSAKWGQRSNLVLLLPHGYEGQGPEHSSARLERFLQLSAEHNWTVANVTRSAQYFHLLRWQASRVGTAGSRPLILMTPKSLLRNPRAASPLADFGEGGFRPVMELSRATGEAERLVLSAGKIGIDLEAERESMGEDGRVHLVRVEQLYPFPERSLRGLITGSAKLREIVWVQEEPRNMGAWGYMEPRLRELTELPVRYIGRPERSSPAEGSPDAHKAEQQRILRSALHLG